MRFLIKIVMIMCSLIYIPPLSAEPIDALRCRGDANEDGRVSLRDYYSFRDQLSTGRFDIIEFAQWREMIINTDLICVSSVTRDLEGNLIIIGTRLNSPLIQWEGVSETTTYEAFIQSDHCIAQSFVYQGVIYDLTSLLPQDETCHQADRLPSEFSWSPHLLTTNILTLTHTESLTLTNGMSTLIITPNSP